MDRLHHLLRLPRRTRGQPALQVGTSEYGRALLYMPDHGRSKGSNTGESNRSRNTPVCKRASRRTWQSRAVAGMHKGGIALAGEEDLGASGMVTM